MKKLYDISWQVDEPTYRADKALSYSTLSSYQSKGFAGIEHIFDSISSPSLTFGSAVDSIITGGIDEFKSRFVVADFPRIPASLTEVIKYLFNKYSDRGNLDNVTSAEMIEAADAVKYQTSYIVARRVENIIKDGSTYFKLLCEAKDKEVLTTEVYQQVIGAVNALKNSPNTKNFFASNNPFEPDIYREYQLKFKATFEGINYRCMADLLVIDYKNKVIYPIDLKTSCAVVEYEFYNAFVKWHYQIQARLYWRIIRDNMDKDPFFKDFTLEDYRFIIVNNKSQNPLIWLFKDTQKYGTLKYGSNIKMPDPFDLAKELNLYLSEKHIVPLNISMQKSNDIVEFLNNIE